MIPYGVLFGATVLVYTNGTTIGRLAEWHIGVVSLLLIPIGWWHSMGRFSVWSRCRWQHWQTKVVRTTSRHDDYSSVV